MEPDPKGSEVNVNLSLTAPGFGIDFYLSKFPQVICSPNLRHIIGLQLPHLSTAAPPLRFVPGEHR